MVIITRLYPQNTGMIVKQRHGTFDRFVRPKRVALSDALLIGLLMSESLLADDENSVVP